MPVVLIAGASGLFGSHASAAFAAAGWQVRHYQRGTDMTATGADVIVNALNPPNYHNWAQLIPQITAQVLDAARTSGATILLAGNVYNYGTAAGPWGPDTPQNPQTRKGKFGCRWRQPIAPLACPSSFCAAGIIWTLRAMRRE